MAKYKRRPKAERNAMAGYPRVNFAGLKAKEYTPANDIDSSCFTRPRARMVCLSGKVAEHFERKIRKIRGEKY